MGDAFERILQLVAEGRLTAEEASPILDALAVSAAGSRPAAPTGPSVKGNPPGDAGADSAGKPRFARIEIRDAGKRVVDLRIPISLGRLALGRVPGLSAQHISDVERAVASGDRGPILDIADEAGDGVRIVLE